MSDSANLPVFPQLPGQGWSVHKRPSFSTRTISHVSGREVRIPLYTQALYEFELTFDALAANGAWPGLGVNSLQSLMGLYLQCQGQYGTFLYTDPTDNAVTGQVIAVGDGATVSFPFQRALGGAVETVSYVTGASSITVNDVALRDGWSVMAPNSLTFTAAPASGAVVKADFTFAYECRFLDDQNDFENFMNGLWTVSSLKFRSVKA